MSTPLVESVLVANRGEIACRIFRTCRRLGIATVAVYSEADRDARHVREADRAVCIGPAPAAQSYLDVARIVAAALASGARAIHPGYGFLSERPELADSCVAAGLVWVGPHAEAIRRMGSKIEAKRIAQAAGIPCVPGYEGDDQNPGRLLDEARRLGFPLLIKASAGGGGKGMRRVDSAPEFPSLLRAAQSEALRAFGDDRVLLERLIARPRHLEVQLVGDCHGGLIHLFERECSIQRHYQKIVEEAPAAHLPQLVRERLYERALKLGRGTGYDSLGTVEFVLETGSEEPYFLEMNTRLQVEHTVTEQITGLDLVELQLCIASGARLALEQPQQPQGWAIEARITCEDPAHDFRPQPGAVRHYREAALDGLRIDSGIDEHSTVPPHYDSLVAKLIGFGLSRATAQQRLLHGLEAFEAIGIGSNQAFLLEALRQPQFLTEPLHTGYLREHFGEHWRGTPERAEQAAIVLAYAQLRGASGTASTSTDPWQAANAFRTMRGAGRSGHAGLRVTDADTETGFDIALEPRGEAWSVRLGERAQTLRLRWTDALHVELAGDGIAPQRFAVMRTDDDEACWTVSQLGQRWTLRVQSALAALAQVRRDSANRASDVRAQMPGLVTRVYVVEGQAVRAGEPLVEMEAMKLILQLTAASDGLVTALSCKTGDTLSQHQRLLTICPALAANEVRA